jgi:hypothetical protein
MNHFKLNELCTNEAYDGMPMKRGYFVQQWSDTHFNAHVVVRRV